jgi:hypothetical protein
MYICDILSIEEYAIFPGAYMYKNHPIYKVDIIGVIHMQCSFLKLKTGTVQASSTS